MRDGEKRKITKYISNGFEILKENPWKGQWIPIIPCLGKELWLDQGNGTVRVLQSLIRLARKGGWPTTMRKATEAEGSR